MYKATYRPLFDIQPVHRCVKFPCPLFNPRPGCNRTWTATVFGWLATISCVASLLGTMRGACISRMSYQLSFCFATLYRDGNNESTLKKHLLMSATYISSTWFFSPSVHIRPDDSTNLLSLLLWPFNIDRMSCWLLSVDYSSLKVPARIEDAPIRSQGGRPLG